MYTDIRGGVQLWDSHPAPKAGCPLCHGGLPGRKGDGSRTSPREPALATEGPDGPPDSSWQKSVASI